LFGLVIAVCGTKKDLELTQDEISEMIGDHGGEYSDDVSEAVNVR
jgi:hypothetical protein